MALVFMSNEEIVKAFNEEPAIRTIDIFNKKYSLGDMRCYFANSDFMRARPSMDRTWWFCMPLKVILHDADEDDSNMEIVDEFCNFCACYIAKCEGKENVPDQVKFAKKIKNTLFSAYALI